MVAGRPQGGAEMSLETWMRAHDLQIVSRKEGAFVGRLEDFQFDLETHRIYGWRLKASGMFGKTGGIPAADMELIGRDVAFITSEAAIEWGSGRAGPVGGRAWASAYKGTQAISRRGRSLGAVRDFVIDGSGTRVTGLVLHGAVLLPLDGRVQTGPSAIIAESDDVAVELPGDEADEPTNWWARVRSAVGVGQRQQRLEGDAEEDGAP